MRALATYFELHSASIEAYGLRAGIRLVRTPDAMDGEWRGDIAVGRVQPEFELRRNFGTKIRQNFRRSRGGVGSVGGFVHCPFETGDISEIEELAARRKFREKISERTTIFGE